MWSDLGQFIHQLEVRICFWSSATWPPTSCTWALPLCIIVLYGERIPFCLLNLIIPLSNNPPSLLSPPQMCSGRSLIEDLLCVRALHRRYWCHRWVWSYTFTQCNSWKAAGNNRDAPQQGCGCPSSRWEEGHSTTHSCESRRRTNTAGIDYGWHE